METWHFSGYANEVGEAFRSMVHVNVVRFSYLVASSYVAADAVHKGQEASQVRFNTVCEISGRPVDVYENSSLSTLNLCCSKTWCLCKNYPERTCLLILKHLLLKIWFDG